MASNPFSEPHQVQVDQHFGARRKVSDVAEEEDDDAEVSGGGERANYSRHAVAQRNNCNNINIINQSYATTGQTTVNNLAQDYDATAASRQQPETIRVKLNESYFAREKHLLMGLMANARNKVNSMKLFNPVQNESTKQQQEEWSEREKYTLDSLNELKGDHCDFQWNRPEDGREVWSSKAQYYLAITSYSIGLGNVIRFPILVQKNGGLAFIIPFIIMLVLEGIPLFYLELAIGQRMRKAAISCWNLVSPFAAGIGLASAAVSFVIGLYYNTMVAYTLMYLWHSALERPLPYTQCPSIEFDSDSTEVSAKSNSIRRGINDRINVSAHDHTNECQNAGSFQYYWYRQTLDASESVNDWIAPNWPLVISLTSAWLISYLCLVKGLSSSKRVVYVASTFPYVILTLFFLKALTLDGISDGIYYLFEPEWSKLVDPYVWLQAAAQVFFSLGLGFGGLIALSSYNCVNNNCYKDAVKVSLVNFATSIYAGVVIFAILGFKANLDHRQCLIEREQHINYYLSDYNLKVLDYGSVFELDSNINNKRSVNAEDLRPIEGLTNSIEAQYPLSSERDQNNRDEDDANEDRPDSNEDYYDAEDAVASIKNLDRILDESEESAEKTDGDFEYKINAKALISQKDLDKVISEIPGLPTCSVRQELEDSTQGTGLVFVVITEAITRFDNATTWVVVFFLMLLTLGFDSQFGNLEGLLSSVTDLKFIGGATALSRQWVTGIVCALSLLISVIAFAHSAGSYVFAIFDEYAGSFSLVLIALFELVAISYIYGLKRFCDDCELMTGKRPHFIIMLSWRYISPILLFIIVIATIQQFKTSINYEAWVGDHNVIKTWPDWCIVMGAVLIIVCIIWIPAIAILRILKIRIVPEENLNRCWFPAEELREFHEIREEHKVTKLERILLGFSPDDY